MPESDTVKHPDYNMQLEELRESIFKDLLRSAAEHGALATEHLLIGLVFHGCLKAACGEKLSTEPFYESFTSAKALQARVVKLQCLKDARTPCETCGGLTQTRFHLAPTRGDNISLANAAHEVSRGATQQLDESFRP